MSNFKSHFTQGLNMQAFTPTNPASKLRTAIEQYVYNQGVKASAHATVAQAHELGYPVPTHEGVGSMQYSQEANALYARTLRKAA